MLAAAFAAKACGRPVRYMLDRDHDMIMTGTRHSFLAEYEIAVDNEGVMKALKVLVQ